MFNQDELVKQLKSAFRKFKTHTYYDNYGAINRKKIADFEVEESISSSDDFFEKLALELLNEEKRKKLFENVSNIDILCYPKSREHTKFLGNIPKDDDAVKKLNYFIDLDIKSHILGTLWILRSGWILDHRLNKNIHGNRINKEVLKRIIKCEKDFSKYSDLTPFLFEPYFKRYQIWRDEGLDSVEKLLDKNENAIVLSLDFKEYYYTSTINFKKLKLDIKSARRKLLNIDYTKCDNEEDKFDEELTDFIAKIFKEYSKLFTRPNYEKNLPLIPIGFLPSLIISNWNLQAFDQSILNIVNPDYYGRYVDDVLIVFKISPKSESFSKENFEKTAQEIIEKYLTPNPPNPNHDIVRKIDADDDDCDKKIIDYGVNNLSEKDEGKKSIKSNYENLRIQSDKLKVFIFNHNHSRALIENFKKEIYRNSSEFRLMHEVENLYADVGRRIFSIQYTESINKFGEIESIKLNKFELSKTLSWLIRSTIYETDNISEENRKNIVQAFSGNRKIDFMTLWEKLIEFLFIQKKYKILEEEIKNIHIKISHLKYKPDKKCNKSTYYYNKDSETLLKKSLKLFLISTYARVSSLRKADFKDKHLDSINKLFINYSIDKLRNRFVLSYLNKTSLMKDPLFLINKNLNKFLLSNYDLIDPKSFNFDNVDKIYQYYPRYIQFHEVTIHILNTELFTDKQLNINKYLLKSRELYNSLNGFETENMSKSVNNKVNNDKDDEFRFEKNLFYKNTCEAANECSDNKCKFIVDYNISDVRVHVIKSGFEKKNKLEIGLLNTKLREEYLEKALIGNPDRTAYRLDRISAIINEAIHKKVELLLMPEMYIPYEWVPGILDVSRTHNMAMVFGIEPIIHGKCAGNYIGIALPSETEGKQKNCTLIMRLKNSYSPGELREYRKHNLKPRKNRIPKYEYVLCNWNDIYFAPYYCYEIANIDHRAIFKSCCDIITVSEYNKDTAYFTAIAESLSRDLFCYCIKVNSSEFGGTCILQPSKNEKKYLVNLKGGEDYVVTHNLDIMKLRTQQIFSYESPTKDTELKPKPPGFDIDKVRMRMNLLPRDTED